MRKTSILLCLEHAEAHARKWKAAQREAVLLARRANRKLTNSELLARQRVFSEVSLEAVHPNEAWGTCCYGAQAPYHITECEMDPLRWACREHARQHALAWNLIFEEWHWEPLVGEWVRGPV